MLKLICLLSFASFAQSLISTNPLVGTCLSSLVTKELSVAHNYLQLSLKYGSTDGYPGFASLFAKLSDEHFSKGHDLTKLLAKRRFVVERLIEKTGLKVRTSLTKSFTVTAGLTDAQTENKEAWDKVLHCHGEASGALDQHVTDYLESNFLDHHVEIDKQLADIQERLNQSLESERKLVTYMIDEELLQTYGDRRSKIFE